MASHKLIKTVTVGSTSQSSIVFDNIPQTFNDLKIIAVMRGDAASISSTPIFNLNGDSTSSYQTSEFLQLSGTRYNFGNWVGTRTYGAGALATFPDANGNANRYSNYILYIPQYSKNLSTQNVILKEYPSQGNNVEITLIRWTTGGSISKIAISGYNPTSNFIQYSSFSLYGISNR